MKNKSCPTRPLVVYMHIYKSHPHDKTQPTSPSYNSIRFNWMWGMIVMCVLWASGHVPGKCGWWVWDRYIAEMKAIEQSSCTFEINRANNNYTKLRAKSLLYRNAVQSHFSRFAHQPTTHTLTIAYVADSREIGGTWNGVAGHIIVSEWVRESVFANP